MKRLLLILLALLISSLVVAIVFRTTLAEWALREALQRQGVQEVHLRIDSLNLSQATLSDLAVGGPGELEGRQLRLLYRPAGLARGLVDQVILDDFSIALDLRAGKGLHPLLDKLGHLDKGQRDSISATPWPVPNLVLNNVTANLTTDLGPHALTLEGELWSEVRNAVAGALSFQLDGPVAGIEGLLALSGETEAGQPQILGQVIVEQGELRLPEATAEGLLGEAGFLLFQNDLRTLDASFTLDGLHLNTGQSDTAKFKQASVNLSLVDENLSLTGDLRGGEDDFHLALKVSAEEVRSRPKAQIEGTLSAAAASDLWQGLGLQGATEGEASVTFVTLASLPALSSLDYRNPDWLARSLQEASLESHLAFDLKDLTLPEQLEGLSGSGNLRLDLAEATLGLSATGPVTLRLADSPWLRARLEESLPPEEARTLAQSFTRNIELSLSPRKNGDLLAALYVSDSDMTVISDSRLSVRAENGASLELSGLAEITLHGDQAPKAFSAENILLSAKGIRLSGIDLDELHIEASGSGLPAHHEAELKVTATIGSLEDGPWRAEAIETSLGGTYQRDGSLHRFIQNDKGKIQLGRLEGPADLRLQKPLSLTFSDIQLIHEIEDRKAASDLKARISPAQLVLALGSLPSSSNLPENSMTLGWSDITLTAQSSPSDQLAVTASSPSITAGAEGYNFVLRDLRSRITQSQDGPLTGTISGSELQEVSINPYLAAPQEPGLEFSWQPQQSTFGLRAGWPGAPESLQLSGDYDPATEVLAFLFELTGLQFDRAGLQPETLSPRAEILKSVEGNLLARSRLRWHPEEGIDGEAMLSAQEISFEIDSLPIKGLNLSLLLDDLDPLVSSPRQRLTIKEIDPGLPVKEIDLLFSLEDDQGHPTLVLEEGTFELLRSQMKIEPARIDISGPQQAVTLAIEALGLETLLAELQAEGLEGDGVLDGTLPLRFENGELVVDGGHLAARGPGRLRYRSESASSLLAGSAEQVNLMLKALEDFHYETLELELDKAANNDLIARLSLLGHNPDVLEGHPFQININLETNIGQLLEALTVGLAISRDALQQIWNP